MPHGLASSGGQRALEAPQGEGLRRLEIADAMLMMDGQRLFRFAGDVRRTTGDSEQLAPARCGFVVSFRAPF